MTAPSSNPKVNHLPPHCAVAAPSPLTRRRGRPNIAAGLGVEEGELLDAAFDMFARHGYEATTLRELSRQLGISHNLLNVRFGSKETLWRTAVSHRLRNATSFVELAFEARGDAEHRLRELIRRFCLWAVAHPDIVSLSYMEAQRSTWRLDHIVQHFILPFKLRLDGLIDEVRSARRVHPVSTAALMALLVQGVGFFFAARPLHSLLGDAAASVGRSDAEEAAMLADFICRGLLPDL